MEQNQIHNDLASIRNLMERSSRFISLSGLSGILAGVYALIGAWLAHGILTKNPDDYHVYRGGTFSDIINPGNSLFPLVIIALAVLAASLITGVILSYRKSKRKQQQFWSAASKALLFHLAVPLFSGGLLMLIFLTRGYVGFIAPASLVFYGLALTAASNFTFSGAKYLGLSEIALGLVAALYPGYGLYFWAIGFGVLHIIYGIIMYIKFDR